MPLAWKIDTNLAIILKTDLNLFAELILHSFLRNIVYINNYLPLIRIESKEYKQISVFNFCNFISTLSKHFSFV